MTIRASPAAGGGSTAFWVEHAQHTKKWPPPPGERPSIQPFLPVTRHRLIPRNTAVLIEGGVIVSAIQILNPVAAAIKTGSGVARPQPVAGHIQVARNAAKRERPWSRLVCRHR